MDEFLEIQVKLNGGTIKAGVNVSVNATPPAAIEYRIDDLWKQLRPIIIKAAKEKASIEDILKSMLPEKS